MAEHEVRDGIGMRPARRFGRPPAPSTVVEIVDSLVASPVLVFGSLPPRGRDLDLLVRPPEQEALVRGLADAGFVNKGRMWARFAACDADAVELLPAADWRLPDDELSRLFTWGVPLPGVANLIRPAPHHRLVIMARKIGRVGGALEERRTEEIAAALAEDPDAWRNAHAVAQAWRAERLVTGLEARWRHTIGEETLDGRRADRLQHAPRLAASSVRRKLRARRKPGVLIALSGLDGCGKSTQAANLQRTLERLGEDPLTEWTSIVNQPAAVTKMKTAANLALRALARVRRMLEAGRHPTPAAPADHANSLRKQSGAVSFGWGLLQGTITAVRQRRMALRHLRNGRIVICDRYTLDALVHLRFAYRESHGAALQAYLMRKIPPPASLSYFLDVDPREATRRKADYTLDDNVERAGLYRDLAPRYGAIRIDGELPQDEICAAIARDVWLLSG